HRALPSFPTRRSSDLLEEVVKEVLSRHPGCSYRFAVAEQYRNMKQVVDRHPQIMEIGLEAIRRAGMEPIRRSIRGGTDGSRLSRSEEHTSELQSRENL